MGQKAKKKRQLKRLEQKGEGEELPWSLPDSSDEPTLYYPSNQITPQQQQQPTTSSDPTQLPPLNLPSSSSTNQYYPFVLPYLSSPSPLRQQPPPFLPSLQQFQPQQSESYFYSQPQQLLQPSNNSISDLPIHSSPLRVHSTLHPGSNPSFLHQNFSQLKPISESEVSPGPAPCPSFYNPSSSTMSNSHNIPIGVFWDIENCHIPKGKSAFHAVQLIRELFFFGYNEAEFTCVCDVHKESAILIQELNDANINVVHVSGNSKNAADDKLRQAMRRFADLYAPDPTTLILPTIILISGDINFSTDLYDFKFRKRLQVILLHNKHAPQALLHSASRHYDFYEILISLPPRSTHPEEYSESKSLMKVTTTKGGHIPMDIIVSELPASKPVTKIKQRLKKLSDNCGGRVMSVQGSFGVIRFANKESALRACKRMNGEDVFGNKIRVFYQSQTELCQGRDAPILQAPSPSPSPSPAPPVNPLNGKSPNKFNKIPSSFSNGASLHSAETSQVLWSRNKLLTYSDDGEAISSDHGSISELSTTSASSVDDCSSRDSSPNPHEDTLTTDNLISNLSIGEGGVNYKGKVYLPLGELRTELKTTQNSKFLSNSQSSSSRALEPLPPPPPEAELELEKVAKKSIKLPNPLCKLHCESPFDEIIGKVLPNVTIELKSLSIRARHLIKSHCGSLPLLSFMICYEKDYKAMRKGSELEVGVPLEHLLSCIPEIVIRATEGGVKVLTWEEKRSHNFDFSIPSASQLTLTREMVELLKSKPGCTLPFDQLIPAYHQHFGRQCKIKDYGHKTLSSLLGSLPNEIQVYGDGDEKVVTLSHRAQMKRFATEALRVLKKCTGSRISITEFPQVYAKVFPDQRFGPEEYGLCTLHDLMSELIKYHPSLVCLVKEGEVESLALFKNEMMISTAFI